MNIHIINTILLTLSIILTYNAFDRQKRTSKAAQNIRPQLGLLQWHQAWHRRGRGALRLAWGRVSGFWDRWLGPRVPAVPNKNDCGCLSRVVDDLLHFKLNTQANGKKKQGGSLIKHLKMLGLESIPNRIPQLLFIQEASAKQQDSLWDLV